MQYSWKLHLLRITTVGSMDVYCLEIQLQSKTNWMSSSVKRGKTFTKQNKTKKQKNEQAYTRPFLSHL